MLNTVHRNCTHTQYTLTELQCKTNSHSAVHRL